jgi:DedD protein
VSDGLKQRIVGAIVLGAIGVILLPLLLDFTDPHKIDRSSIIPPVPSIDAVKVVTAKRPAEIKDSSEVDKVFDVSRLQPVKEKDTQYHGLDKSGFPQRWYLQVGSYEDQGAAKQLKQTVFFIGCILDLKSTDKALLPIKLRSINYWQQTRLF